MLHFGRTLAVENINRFPWKPQSPERTAKYEALQLAAERVQPKIDQATDNLHITLIAGEPGILKRNATLGDYPSWDEAHITGLGKNNRPVSEFVLRKERDTTFLGHLLNNTFIGIVAIPVLTLIFGKMSPPRTSPSINSSSVFWIKPINWRSKRLKS